MVSNELTKIAQLIKIHEGFSKMEEVAKAIGYRSRSHFSKELKKGTSEEIRDKMFAKYPELFTAQNVLSISNQDKKPGADVIMPVGNLKKTLADYVDLMERYNAVLEGRILSVGTNLEQLQASQMDISAMIKGGLADLAKVTSRVTGVPLDQVKHKTSKVIDATASSLKKSGKKAVGSQGKG
jgi:hypothetical protein